MVLINPSFAETGNLSICKTVFILAFDTTKFSVNLPNRSVFNGKPKKRLYSSRELELDKKIKEAIN